MINGLCDDHMKVSFEWAVVLLFATGRTRAGKEEAIMGVHHEAGFDDRRIGQMMITMKRRVQYRDFDLVLIRLENIICCWWKGRRCVSDDELDNQFVSQQTKGKSGAGG